MTCGENALSRYRVDDINVCRVPKCIGGTLEKNLNFLTQYSCRIDDCPLAFLTFIKFPEVQDRAYFPSQFPAHVLKF